MKTFLRLNPLLWLDKNQATKHFANRVRRLVPALVNLNGSILLHDNAHPYTH